MKSDKEMSNFSTLALPKEKGNATFNSATIRVQTPDGTMFLVVMEDEKGNPFETQIYLGKTGGAAYAWAAAMGSMISVALRNGVSIEKIAQELSNITSGAAPRLAADGSKIRSGVEGIYRAIMIYRRSKFDDIQRSLPRTILDLGPRVNTY